MINDNHEGRRQIGFRPPGSADQHIVPLLPVQLVRSLQKRALWIGLVIGGAIGGVLVLALWLLSKWRTPDPHSSPEPESLPSCPPLGLLGTPKAVPTA